MKNTKLINQHHLPVYPAVVRKKWYWLVDKGGLTVKEVCSRYFIPRKTYYKWRSKDKGNPTYIPKKEHPNTKLTKEVKRFIAEAKRKTNYGPEKMKLWVKRKLYLDVSTTIIQRFYHAKKLIRKPQRKLPWYEPMREKLTITKPGEGVQLDIKYVYEHGVRKYQFSVFDPYTKKYHFTVFHTKHSINAVTAFQNAEQYFGFKILSVQTDNGSEFRGDFHTWLIEQKITHYFIPKKSPWWNGNVERVHRTIDDEYYQNPFRVWNSPQEWLEYYNHERIHLSIGGLTPEEKLKSVTLEC